MAVAAAATVATATIGSSIISSNAAGNAADTQADATRQAAQNQADMFNITQNNLSPYMQTGRLANTAIQNATGLNTENPLMSSLLAPVSMNEAQLQQTPGYQFNLQQGLKAVQNSAAARGLGVSGAAAKGAATYATGLADNTYQNQFANAVTNQTNQFNRLNTLSSGGQNAAAGLGGIGQQTAANIASTTVGGANAAAASQIAGSNALASGISGAANNISAGLYGNQGASTFSNYDQEAANNGLPWSDINLKKNIIPRGEQNGYPIYEFEYLWSPIRYIGVMAQDIMKVRPGAVKQIGEYFAVDYSKLGIQFRSIS